MKNQENIAKSLDFLTANRYSVTLPGKGETSYIIKNEFKINNEKNRCEKTTKKIEKIINERIAKGEEQDVCVIT